MLLQELFALKLKLELCGVKDSSNMLHHMCHTKFDGGFEKKIGLVFRCLDCISKCMVSENKAGKISKLSNKVSDTIEIEDEKISR